MKETSVNTNSIRLSQVLTEVIEENRIQMRSLLRETGIKNERLYDIKKVLLLSAKHNNPDPNSL